MAGNYTKCEKERKKNLHTSGAEAKDIYVAQCTENGEYKRLQCNDAAESCWCVDIDGKMTEWAVRNKLGQSSCSSLAGEYL